MKIENERKKEGRFGQIDRDQKMIKIYISLIKKIKIQINIKKSAY